jgi:type I restriction enzyme S subunit
MQTLRSYPNYKAVRVKWLGEIPVHWSEKRAKCFFREIDERSSSGKEELLSVSHTTGVTPRSQKNVTMFKAESYVGHKVARPNDIVINTMWAWMAALGVSKHLGLVSPSYGVYRPLNDRDYLPAFLDYMLRIPPLRWEYVCRSTGIRPSRLRLYPDKFLEIPLPCPPIEEQGRIVRFLRAKEASLRQLMRNKRRLIAIMNEQKRAIINRVISRGLDPSAPMKPGGSYWMQEVPAHWEVKRLKTLVRNVREQTNVLGAGDTYVALEHVRSWTGEIVPPGDEIVFDSQVKRFEAGDILFGKLRPYLAKVARPPIRGVCVGEFLVLRPLDGAPTAQFLEQRLRSNDFIDVVNSSTFGAKMPRAEWDFIGNLRIPYPADPEEQAAVLRSITHQTAALSRVIARTELEITLITEYRERLITDIVTGKLDVREVEITAPADEPKIEDLEEVDNDQEIADQVAEEAYADD